MRISFDLDNTIFDLSVLYQMACDANGCKYTPPADYDIYKSYDMPIADELTKLFSSPHLYETPVISSVIPDAINKLIANPEHDVHFVTERYICDVAMDHTQLCNAGILCNIANVHDCTPKIDALLQLKPDIHFDDSPRVVSDCIRNGINVVMISNPETLYNAHLRGLVEHHTNLVDALRAHNLI